MWVAAHIMSLGGYCPVQADGSVGDREFYFRARGERWSINIGKSHPLNNNEWRHIEDYGDSTFAAGWMSENEALIFIMRERANYLADRAQVDFRPFDITKYPVLDYLYATFIKRSENKE